MCVHVIFVLFRKIKKEKKKGISHTQHAHASMFLSALAERVPCSAPTTSTKSGQADGSNERSAKIIQ